MTEATETNTNFDGPSLKKAVSRNLGRNRFYVVIGGTPYEIMYVHENSHRGRMTWEIQFRGRNFGSLIIEQSGRITVRVVTTT